jgi:predicted DNA-binding transcriptional regulator
VNEYTTKIPRVYYRNESDAETTIQRMLRQFNGFSDELIEELSRLMKGLLPKDIFPNIEKFLSGNLLRLWKDWYYLGIEPKQNTLAEMLKRFFKVFPDHIRVSEIKRLCNVPDQNLASALKQLYEAGLIDKETITGNGRAYTEFWNKQLMPSKLPSIIKKATARPSEDNHYEFKSDEPI